MADPFAHFSEQLGAWSEPLPPKPTRAANGSGLVNKQRQNDLTNKLRSHLDECNFDHVEAERQAVPIDYDNDPDLPD